MRRWPVSTDRRGATLVEVMVTSVILLLLMTALYTLLSYSMRYYQAAHVAESVHQQTLLGLRRLASELRLSDIQTVTYPATPGSVVFLSAEHPAASPGPWTYNASSELLWQKWVCYYLSGDELRRCEQALAAPVTLPPAPAPPALAVFQALPDYRVVARNLTLFTIGPGSSPGLVELVVTARAQNSSDRATELTLRTQTRPEN